MSRNIPTDKKLDQLQALINMAALVNSTLNIQEIKKSAIYAAAGLLDAETGSLLLVDQETGELFFEVALEKSERLGEVRLKKGEGIAGWVAERGTPQIIHDLTSDKRFFKNADIVSGFSSRNMICVPVRTKERILGVLEVVNKREGSFDENDLDILVGFSHHVALAMENALLYEENIRQLKSRLKEEERHAREKGKILKDLHDGIGGITTNISLLAELAQKETSLEDIRKTLATIAELSREGLADIKSFMCSLDIEEGNWRTLMAEIRRIGRSMIEPHGISFVMESIIHDASEEPGSLVSLNVFRIFKEAMTNVIKHSGARNVRVTMDAGPEKLLLSIKDDGIGLEVKGKGRGLSNMSTRAEEIGGRLAVTSGNGTLVCLEIPVPFKYPMEGFETDNWCI
ncbi:MAG TPA: GAF domain-containing protein [Thermodesulfovibrionales bacterium]|nr:GAF domain-containing protein [Thermodesulfovibrionales bacterium]